MKTLVLAAVLAFPALSAAQVEVTTGESGPLVGDEVPDWARKLAIDPESPAARAYAEGRKKRLQHERELKRLRATHFRNIKLQAKRQEGIVKLHDYNDPSLDPLLIEIFEKEQLDVRCAILDMFADRKAEAGDTSLAWVAVFDDSEAVRSEAVTRLRRRQSEEGFLPEASRLVIYEGLRSGGQTAKAAAANLANWLGVVEAIPWMIGAQIGGSPVGGTPGTGRRGDLAWIAVGQQQAFVSDLTPVVGPNAVAFDPQLSVVTTGTLLRVTDAVVVEYHIDIHNALVDMTSRLSGTDTGPLGWHNTHWRDWYRDEFLPLWAAKEEARKAAAHRSAAPAAGPG